MNPPSTKPPATLAAAPPGAPGARARHLLRGAAAATLATLTTAEGWPFASLVSYATDQNGAPLLFLSNLAEHTRNLKRDPRVSLLLDGTADLASAAGRLAGPRLTLIGRADPSTAPIHRTRFLNRHPEAVDYMRFADFAFYRIRIERGHFVAGFGQIARLAPDDLLRPPSAALAQAEPELVDQVNQDYRASLGRIATGLLGLEAAPWRLGGLDREGMDLTWQGHIARLDFEQPVEDPAGFLATLSALQRLAAEAERI